MSLKVTVGLVLARLKVTVVLRLSQTALEGKIRGKRKAETVRATRRVAPGLELRGGQIWSSHNTFLERECGQRVRDGTVSWDSVVPFLASVLAHSVGMAYTLCLSILSCKRRGELSRLLFGENTVCYHTVLVHTAGRGVLIWTLERNVNLLPTTNLAT